MDAFYSTLKGENLLANGNNLRKALKITNEKEMPLTKEENYAKLRNLWAREGIL